MAACGPAHNPWYFFILFPTWRCSLITPNQEQQCLPKAFTESWELHRHQIHSGIIQARGMAWRCDGCLQEGARPKGKNDGDRERRETYFHLISPQPRLNSAPLDGGWARMGQDQLAATCQVKLQNQTIKLRHALSLNTITWRLRMDNPLKPDQRKVWILKWAAECVYMQKELIRAAVYMSTACNPVRVYSASFHEEFCLFLLAWKTAQINVL